MNTVLRGLGITVFHLLLASSSLAEPAKTTFVKMPELKCPEEIAVAPDQKLNRTPKGWRKFVDRTNFKARLERVNFYSGAPETLAMLKPDDDGAVQLSSEKHEGWVACVYTDTVVQLTRKIPKRFHVCRAVSVSKEAQDRNPQLGYLDAVECKEGL